MKKYIVGMLVGIGLCVAGTAVAATSYVYKLRHAGSTEVTSAQAATGADWYIARGAWSGDRGDIDFCALWRNRNDSPDTFWAYCDGRKTAAAADVPVGVEILEAVP